MNSSRLDTRYLLFAVALAVPGCRGGGERHAEGADAVAGHTVSLSHVATHPALQRLDFETTNSIGWVGDSAIALLDVYNKQLVIKDIHGERERRLGREGGGPGEFESPIRLLTTEDGDVFVADSKTMRVSQFDFSSRFIRSQPMQGMPLQLLRYDDERLTMAWIGFFGPADPAVGDLDLASGIQTKWFSVFEADPGLAHVRDGSMGPSRFLTVALGPHGQIIVGEGAEYRIVVFDSAGSLKTTMSRPGVEPEFPSEREIQEYEVQLRKTFERAVPLPTDQLRSAVQRFRDRAKPYFHLDSFAVDRGGRLWVATSRGERDSTFVDIFDSSGSYSETIVLQDRALALRFRGSMLAVLAERRSGPDEGLRGVDVYRADSE